MLRIVCSLLLFCCILKAFCKLKAESPKEQNQTNSTSGIEVHNLTDTEKAVRELSTFQLNPTMPDSKGYGAKEQSINSIFDPQFFPRPQGEKKLG